MSLFPPFIRLALGLLSLFVSSYLAAQTYSAPTMISPTSGSAIVQSSQNPCFTWSMSGATGFSNYTITVSTTPDFPTTRWQYQLSSISATSVCWNNGSGWVSKGSSPPPAPGALQLGTTYYWRVLATYTNGTQTGNTVTGIPFTIAAPPPPTPVLNSPADGATIYSSSQNPCFSWSMSSSPIFTNYTVTVSTTLSFPTTRWQYQTTSISATSVCWNNGAGWVSKGTSPPPAPGPLLNGTTYYWRVLASYSDGSMTGDTFAGRSFVHRFSSSSSASTASSKSSSSSSVKSSVLATSSSVASIQARTTRYTYDALGRLTFVEDSQNGNRDYDYDAAGNRLLVATKTTADTTAEPAPPPAPTGLSKSLIASCAWRATWNSVSGATRYLVKDTTGTTVYVTTTYADISCPVGNSSGNMPYSVQACDVTSICGTKAYF